MRFILALATAIGIAATPAIAADPPKKEKKICKRSDIGSTGSRISRSSRVCLTASEWQEIEDAAQRAVRDNLENRYLDPDAAGPPQAGGPS